MHFIHNYFKTIQFLIIFIIIMNCTSCKENHYKIKTVHAIGLGLDTLDTSPMLFLSKDTGFLAGYCLVNTKNPDYPEKDDKEYLRNKWESILFKTVDGGETWTNKVFGEGCIVQIDQFGDSIIALLKNDSYTKVFTSSKYTPDNWIERTSFPKYVSHVFAYGDQMAAIATDSFKYHNFFCFSNNNGKDWTGNFDPIHEPYHYPVLKDGKLFYFARFERTNGYPDSLVVYDIASHNENLISLPRGFSCPGLTCIQKNLYLTGMNNENILIYRIDPNLEIKKLYNYPANGISGPLRFYKSSSADWILAVKEKMSRKKIVIMKIVNNGKSLETFEIDYIHNIYLHFFIEQDGVVKMWFFNKSGKFQVLESGAK